MNRLDPARAPGQSLPAMNFMRSKGEHLAEHLREAIARGEIVEPLPTIRDWSTRLGVSHGTMETALNILKREGIVRARPRKGLHLVSRARPHLTAQRSPIVRLILSGRHYRYTPSLPWAFSAISLRLGAHKIGTSLELLTEARLKTIHQQGEHDHELLVFSSLPKHLQELFCDFKKSALLVGKSFPGISLPFILIDVISAFRHATCLLARRGFERVTLVVNAGGRQPVDDEFRQMCSDAPRAIHGEVVRLPDELYEQNQAVQRLAVRIKPRHGLICNSPVPASALITALLQRGVAVPGQTEVIAVNALPSEIRTVPIPIHYPCPLDRFAKAVSQAAIHYFEQGALPRLRKTIPLEMVSPTR